MSNNRIYHFLEFQWHEWRVSRASNNSSSSTNKSSSHHGKRKRGLSVDEIKKNLYLYDENYGDSDGFAAESDEKDTSTCKADGKEEPQDANLSCTL